MPACYCCRKRVYGGSEYEQGSFLSITQTLYKKTTDVLKSLHSIKPDIKVKDLSISNQQVVEIAKALTLNCKILILDEPTAAF